MKFWSPHLSFHAPTITYFNFILNLNFWINTSQAILLWTWFKTKALVIHLSFDTLTITNFHFIPNLSYWINNAMNNIIMNSTPFFWYNHNHIIYISALNKLSLLMVRYFYISPPFLSLEHFYTCSWIHFCSFSHILFFKLNCFNPNLWTLITLCHLHILNMPYSKIHTIPPTNMNGECVHTNKGHPHHFFVTSFHGILLKYMKKYSKNPWILKNIIMLRFVLKFCHFQIFSSH